MKHKHSQTIQPLSADNKSQPTKKTVDVLASIGIPSEEWVLGERETICVHNCAKGYLKTKAFLHDQLLMDFSAVRKKNRDTFESM